MRDSGCHNETKITIRKNKQHCLRHKYKYSDFIVFVISIITEMAENGMAGNEIGIQLEMGTGINLDLTEWNENYLMGAGRIKVRIVFALTYDNEYLLNCIVSVSAHRSL